LRINKYAATEYMYGSNALRDITHVLKAIVGCNVGFLLDVRTYYCVEFKTNEIIEMI